MGTYLIYIRRVPIIISYMMGNGRDDSESQAKLQHTFVKYLLRYYLVSDVPKFTGLASECNPGSLKKWAADVLATRNVVSRRGWYSSFVFINRLGRVNETVIIHIKYESGTEIT
jgi:hypothetical protein